jgi:hypothetical protein
MSSFCSTAPADVDRRRRRRDSTPAKLQATRVCASRPIRPKVEEITSVYLQGIDSGESSKPSMPDARR